MNEVVTIPIGWILTTIISLGGIITTLAGIIYSSLSARIAAQDKIITGLRKDIERMSQGCGQSACLWKGR